MTVTIADILLQSTPTAQVGDSLAHVYQLMDQEGFNVIIVMQDDKPLGMLSKGALTFIQQQNIDSQSAILASHIPSNSIAKLELSMPLQKAFDFLFDHQLRQLAIINEHGELEGLLTLECIIKNLSGKSSQHNIKHTPEISTDTENYYKKLMQAIPEAVIIHHLDHILFANPASLELLAWDPEHDIIELPLMGLIHPDSQATINQHMDNLQQNPSKKLASIEERLIRHDGKIVWVEMSCSISKHQGKTVVISVFRDISRRKKAELESQLLKKTINTIQESIFITNPDGVIQYANQSFTRIMGYTAQEALGKTPEILNSRQQSKEFYTHLWQTLKSGKPWSGRIMNRHKDGTIFPVYMSIAPMFNAQQEITNFVAIHEDLTHDEALQHKIMQVQKMEAVSTMVGGIAHDFNNLLATILGNLYLMRKKMQGDEKGMSRIQTMEKTIHHGANMIQQMLTFSRQDSPDMNTMNMLAFLKETAKLAESILPENIQFTLDYSPATKESYIQGNLHQLRQVILSLVNNAKDAVNDVLDPKIRVTLSQQDPSPDMLLNYTGSHKEGEWQCLRCEDNGYGIAQEHIDKIFDPFFTTKTVGEGSGLGLAMVYGAVQNHHGLIAVESKPHVGTTLSIYIPNHNVSELQLIASEESFNHGKGQSILLVDDDEPLRNVLDEILKESGFKILQASNGQEAVNIFTENQDDIAIIIMDVVMPVMGGVAAAKRIRNINAAIPIIFQTGYGEQTELNAAASIEHCGTLRKPLQVHELLTKIQEKLAPSNNLG